MKSSVAKHTLSCHLPRRPSMNAMEMHCLPKPKPLAALQQEPTNTISRQLMMRPPPELIKPTVLAAQRIWACFKASIVTSFKSHFKLIQNCCSENKCSVMFFALLVLFSPVKNLSRKKTSHGMRFSPDLKCIEGMTNLLYRLFQHKSKLGQFRRYTSAMKI